MSEFKIDKIENNQGSVSMGDGSTSTYNNHASSQGLEEITKKLIELIGENSDMPEDTKEELTGTVSTISSQALSDKPNKSMVGALYGTVEKVISLASKSTELVTAFEKWKELITPIFS